ncbi:MAG TPA: hypothetical protein VIF62_27245 [Labilithrix sp.]|jgi:hypothetical protein
MNHSLSVCIAALVTCALVGCAADPAPPTPEQEKSAAEEAMEQHVREARESKGDIQVQNRIDITCTSTTQGSCTTYCCSDGWCGTGCY